MRTHFRVMPCIVGVTQFKVGDEVFGVAPGCLGRSVIVHNELLVLKPPFISFEDAATTPTVYVTVFEAFGDLSSFDKKQKVGGKCCPLGNCLPRHNFCTLKPNALQSIPLTTPWDKPLT